VTKVSFVTRTVRCGDGLRSAYLGHGSEPLPETLSIRTGSKHVKVPLAIGLAPQFRLGQLE
jgi:hypothetical protein